MLARRFLWIVTILVILILAGALAYRLFAPDLMRIAFVPSAAFKEDPAPGPDYSSPAMWAARPGMAGNPALWLPQGVRPPSQPGRAAIFFVHPTSFLDKSRWNAPLEDPETNGRTRIFVQSQASAFNHVGEIWAPRYRQATVGAFFTERGDADAALAFAYRDVAAAFDAFLQEVPADRPIILAGHSQGSFHLTRLLAEKVAGTPIARRIAAAYVIGWPISLTVDLPRLGLPSCRTAEDNGCILAWQSFAEPAEPDQLMDIYEASVGPEGQSRAGSPLLCIDPLTGTSGGSAPASANLGTLIPNLELTDADLRPGGVPARCDERGLLLIGENPPEMPPYVLPGNNYHVFDYSLFWANIRADAERRLSGFRIR